jgi:hypothetical protein
MVQNVWGLLASSQLLLFIPLFDGTIYMYMVCALKGAYSISCIATCLDKKIVVVVYGMTILHS